jgi:hypothetical protein
VNVVVGPETTPLVNQKHLSCLSFSVSIMRWQIILTLLNLIFVLMTTAKDNIMQWRTQNAVITNCMHMLFSINIPSIGYRNSDTGWGYYRLVFDICSDVSPQFWMMSKAMAILNLLISALWWCWLNSLDLFIGHISNYCLPSEKWIIA